MDRDYYTSSEMLEILGYLGINLHRKFSKGEIPKPIKIDQRHNLYLKKTFWNWAASQEAAQIIDPKAMPEKYQLEREKELIF